MAAVKGNYGATVKMLLAAGARTYLYDSVSFLRRRAKITLTSILILQNMKSALDFAQSPAVRALVEGHSKWTLVGKVRLPGSSLPFSCFYSDQDY
jgi:hypothetical protein